MSVSAAIKTRSAPPPLPQTAGDLARPATIAGPATTNAEVMALFAQSPELNAVVVVDQDRPIGLINRNAFFDRFTATSSCAAPAPCSWTGRRCWWTQACR